MSWLFTSGSQSIGASASASVLPVIIHGWFPLELTGLISFCPKDSQESSPTPQLESISSSAFSLLYGPTLTSIYDYWIPQYWLYRPLSTKWCICFLICCLGLSSLFVQGASIFSFQGCSHHLQWFAAQENKISLLPLYCRSLTVGVTIFYNFLWLKLLLLG